MKNQNIALIVCGSIAAVIFAVVGVTMSMAAQETERVAAAEKAKYDAEAAAELTKSVDGCIDVENTKDICEQATDAE